VFAYEDHEAPWSVVAPNIDLSITNKPHYNGEATFHDGRVAIQQFAPMWAHAKMRFTIDGSRLVMDRIDLESDGARSQASGEIFLSQWPEQTYSVQSHVSFPRMREIFFRQESWALSGDGDFDGTFHLFKGGHELSGRFNSPLVGLYAYRFPSLRGAL